MIFVSSSSCCRIFSLPINTLLLPAYDQDFGQRNRAAIPNAQGITNFRVVTQVTRPVMGSNPTIVKTTEDDLLETQLRKDYNLLDGDRLVLTITATDFVSNTKTETIDNIYVDSSPPEISNLWLVRNEMHISVHYSKNLQDMT